MEEKNMHLLVKFVKTSNADRKKAALIENIGPTIMGVKPATLINIKCGDILSLCQSVCEEYESLGLILIKRYETGGKVFVYHKESLESILSQREVRGFLHKLGYPKSQTVEKYLSSLSKRILETVFPHEIGLFLGYPVEDVCGFMGAPIPYRKTMGWRMYGDVNSSERIYNKFMEARTYVREMVQQYL